MSTVSVSDIAISVISKVITKKVRIYIHIFVCNLFNYVLSNSDYTASNKRMTDE
jgi:hypothetical protein